MGDDRGYLEVDAQHQGAAEEESGSRELVSSRIVYFHRHRAEDRLRLDEEHAVLTEGELEAEAAVEGEGGCRAVAGIGDVREQAVGSILPLGPFPDFLCNIFKTSRSVSRIQNTTTTFCIDSMLRQQLSDGPKRGL